MPDGSDSVVVVPTDAQAVSTATIPAIVATRAVIDRIVFLRLCRFDDYGYALAASDTGTPQAIALPLGTESMQ